MIFAYRPWWFRVASTPMDYLSASRSRPGNGETGTYSAGPTRTSRRRSIAGLRFWWRKAFCLSPDEGLERQWGFRACVRSRKLATLASRPGMAKSGWVAERQGSASLWTAAPTALLSSAIDIPALPGWAHIWAAGPPGLDGLLGGTFHRYRIPGNR